MNMIEAKNMINSDGFISNLEMINIIDAFRYGLRAIGPDLKEDPNYSEDQVMIVVSHKVLRRARRDPANRGWFEQYSPATLRDFLPQIVVITAIVLFGGWLWQSGNYGWPALCALIATHVVLGYETYSAAKFWNQSMSGGKTV